MYRSLLIVLLGCTVFFSCSKDDEVTPVEIILSSDNLITSFKLNINGTMESGSINGNSITFDTVDADLEGLSPVIEISSKATITPSPSTEQNFNNNVNYTVMAEDGTNRTYTVIVNNVILSTDNLILGFSIALDEQTINADIDNENNTIYFQAGSYDISSIVPSIDISEGATISSNNEPRDFNESLEYTVTAENGDEKTYTVSTNSPKMGDVITVVGVFTNYPLKLYTGAEIIIRGEYLLDESQGAKIYLDDGNTKYPLEFTDYNDYSYEIYSQIHISTEIPNDIPTNGNYKLIYEKDNIFLESESFLDIVAENAPIIQTSNQEVYNYNDVLIFTGKNLPDMISIPSNGNLFLIENSNNYDLNVNSERTELNLTLDYFQLFPSYYARDPHVKIITPLGPNRRAGKPFRVVFD